MATEIHNMCIAVNTFSYSAIAIKVDGSLCLTWHLATPAAVEISYLLF